MHPLSVPEAALLAQQLVTFVSSSGVLTLLSDTTLPIGTVLGAVFLCRRVLASSTEVYVGAVLVVGHGLLPSLAAKHIQPCTHRGHVLLFPGVWDRALFHDLGWTRCLLPLARSGHTVEALTGHYLRLRGYELAAPGGCPDAGVHHFVGFARAMRLNWKQWSAVLVLGKRLNTSEPLLATLREIVCAPQSPMDPQGAVCCCHCRCCFNANGSAWGAEYVT